MNWPSYMDTAHIMAKSQEKGGQTLTEHTWQVLERLADQYQLHPYLESRIWRWLYWGCFLHDFGKAAAGFQQMLSGKKDIEWVSVRHRHEILSLGFVDWLFQKGNPDRPWILAIIAFHHKDFDRIIETYGGSKPFKQLDPWIANGLLFLANQIDQNTNDLLYQWISDYGIDWASQLDIPIGEPPLVTDMPKFSAENLAGSIYKALREIHKWRESLDEKGRQLANLCRGLIVSSDHAASANMGSFEALIISDAIARRPLEMKNFALREHQSAAAKLDAGSAVLIAPTGSGKTEAALLWAARQHLERPASRLFYTLPYQASMNAMARRLSEKFYNIDFNDDNNNTITIQHSRALLQSYRDHMDSEEKVGAKEALNRAQVRQNKTRLNLYPVKIFSPYQMLKVPYRLKGYEPLLIDYTDALFIFDEIHAYEPKRLALIIGLMKWLRQNFGARFFVMTATLPPPVRNALFDALFEDAAATTVLRATDQSYAESRRHVVVRREGDLLNHIDNIAQQYHNGEAVLVCCNTVARAQDAYRQLKAHITDHDIMMLHGRFTGRDRGVKERWLLQRVGTGLSSNQRRPTVFVATQVVEVSLDVDFDTLYTDPAPLEAMLQRFGRVNRGRGAIASLRPVHVFDQPSGADDSKPYDYRYVQRALELLREGPVDEAGIDTMLAQVYTGALAEEWIRDYDNSLLTFKRDVLEEMTPFESASYDIKDAFYRLFDGRQVLPIDCCDSYEQALEAGGYLAASEYLVNVSNGQFHQSKALPYDDYTWSTKCNYTTEMGLDLQSITHESDDNL